MKGHAKMGGRAKGTLNHRTTLIKDAILKAGELAGGKDGLVGYLHKIARTEPAVFCALLRAVLPYQIKFTGTAPLTMILDGATPQDAAREYANTLRVVGSESPPTIEGDAEEMDEERAA